MKRYNSILCILTLAAGVAGAQTGTTAVVVQQYTFAPAGMVAGQSLRLNLSNIAGGTAVCTADLSYVNSDGTSIKNENVTVNAGQTVSYSLLTTDITGSPISAEVRGLVKIDRQAGGVVAAPGAPVTPAPVTPAPVTPAPVCSPVMSLEIVDSIGQTHVIMTSPTLVSGFLPVLTPLRPSPGVQ